MNKMYRKASIRPFTNLFVNPNFVHITFRATTLLTVY